MALTVIAGPPTAGKSTLARQRHAESPGSILIDFDVIAQALGSPVTHGHTETLSLVAGKARNAAIAAAVKASHLVDVIIVDSVIPSWRAKLYEQYGAEIITLDVDRDELHRRADAERPEQWHQLIDDWSLYLADAGPAWHPERERQYQRRPWPKRPAHRRGAHGPRYEALRRVFLADKTNCEDCGEPFVTDAPCHHPRCLRRGKGCVFHPRYPTVDHDVPLATRSVTHVDPLDTSLWRALCGQCNKRKGGYLGQRVVRERAREQAYGRVELDW